MKDLPSLMRGERGHIGLGAATLLGLASAIVLAIALRGDSDALAIAGAVLVGLGIAVAGNAPHIWGRRLYRRRDRIAPDDPDARPNTRIRIEL